MLVASVETECKAGAIGDTFMPAQGQPTGKLKYLWVWVGSGTIGEFVGSSVTTEGCTISRQDTGLGP